MIANMVCALPSMPWARLSHVFENSGTSLEHRASRTAVFVRYPKGARGQALCLRHARGLGRRDHGHLRHSELHK